MPLPGNLTAITLTGTYLTAVGTPCSGTVTFYLDSVIADGTGSVILYPSATPVTLDANGHFSIELPAGDDTHLYPEPFSYRVLEKLTSGQQRTYSLALLSSMAPTVDLSTLIPTQPLTPTGVTITGTPSAGQVPTATGPGTAIWETPAGGGPDPATTVASGTSFGQSQAVGTDLTYAREDHSHGTPTLPTASTGAEGIVQLAGDLGGTATAPSVLKVDGVAVSGSATAGTVFAASSPTAASWQGAAHVGPWVFNIAKYGAVGDGQFVTDGAMASGSAVLTSASAKFGNVVNGMPVMVLGAAPTGVTTLVAGAVSKQSNGQITLNAPNASGGNLTGALVFWGTDDTAAIQAAIDDALAYAEVHGPAKVFSPVGEGLFNVIAGPLMSGGETLGNGQLTLGAPVATTGNKAVLDIEGVVNGSGLQHWQQAGPQFNGSTWVSFGVFASSGAQNTSISNNGNACLLGGPAQPGGYGVSPGVFSNMLVTLRNISFLTTYSLYGLTYSAVDFSGIAEANLENFGYGTTGSVAAGHYNAPAQFANGLSIGVLMPAAGNNDNNRCQNVSCHGGYTFAFFATEHTVVDRLCILYSWSALCVVGIYYGSVGATHGVSVQQASIEACTNVVNFIGVGSNGIGPWLYAVIDTEISNPTFTDRTSGTGLNAALGEVILNGLFNPADVTVAAPTGLKIVNGQAAYPVTEVNSSTVTTYNVTVVDQTILVDTTTAAVTVNLISAAWTPNTYTVVNLGTHAVTVATTGGQTINGASTLVLSSQWAKATVAPARVNSNWNWYQTA